MLTEFQKKKFSYTRLKTGEKSDFFGFLNELSVPASSAVTTGKFTFDSVYRFKGLERQLVILVDLDFNGISEELIYVAMSRARTFLAIMGNEEQLTEFRNLVHS